MVCHISFSWKKIILFISAFVMLYSCSDIINTEPNIGKELLEMSPSDSLNQLVFKNIDFGDVRYGTISVDTVEIENITGYSNIEIYNFASTNPSQLFTYIFPLGLPFNITPGENTRSTGKIIAKFYAQSFYFKEYTDTVILNNNNNYRIVIRANIKSF